MPEHNNDALRRMRERAVEVERSRASHPSVQKHWPSTADLGGNTATSNTFEPSCPTCGGKLERHCEPVRAGNANCLWMLCRKPCRRFGDPTNPDRWAKMPNADLASWDAAAPYGTGLGPMDSRSA